MPMQPQQPPPNPTRRRLSIQVVLLAVHGAGWLIVMAWTAVQSETHLPPPELWTALPLGISAILVAFRTGRKED